MSLDKRYIVHVDMDAFFSVIEQRDNPQLQGKPVVIGADPKQGKGRGVVSTCSYEARKFGIRSAMPITTAYRKCPDAVFLSVDMQKYSDVSCQIHEIFYKFTPDVEPVSVDEAFLDISSSYKLFGTPYQTCLLLKSCIKQKTGLTASVGLAPSKFVAKIASDLDKPDGLVWVKKDAVLKFLWPLEVSRIWGVGRKGAQILNSAGIKTIGDLAKSDVLELVKLFGKNGEHLWKLANGIDEREVEETEEVKSVSNEFTFSQDTLSAPKIEGALTWLCEKVSMRLRDQALKGKTITLKIRLDNFATYTRALTMEAPTNFDETLFKQVRRLYNEFPKGRRKVRLLGVKVSKFSMHEFQEDFFTVNQERKQEQMHKAVDKIKHKFGETAIHRAGSRLGE